MFQSNEVAIAVLEHSHRPKNHLGECHDIEPQILRIPSVVIPVIFRENPSFSFFLNEEIGTHLAPVATKVGDGGYQEISIDSLASSPQCDGKLRLFAHWEKREFSISCAEQRQGTCPASMLDLFSPTVFAIVGLQGLIDSLASWMLTAGGYIGPKLVNTTYVPVIADRGEVRFLPCWNSQLKWEGKPVHLAALPMGGCRRVALQAAAWLLERTWSETHRVSFFLSRIRNY